MTALTLADLTTTSVTGSGAFDTLMRAVKAHLEQEFTQGRIKGTEYATVYLGCVDLAMQNAMAFLMQGRKVDLEALLLDQQLALATLAVEKAQVELAMLQASQAKIPAEITQLEAQTALIQQQKSNAAAEALNIPKQGLVIDAQKTQLAQQTANAVIEGKVLTAQECKLRAEFDTIQAQTLKSNGEIALLAQKTLTERAQVTALGVDADSVVGKQKALYGAQTDGFKRDAEQKAAKVMTDTWSVRRTTDEDTEANTTNMLYDTAVGRAVNKLLAGVGA